MGGLLCPDLVQVEETLEVLVHGSSSRHVASTRMNTDSSRSHTVFSMTLQRRNARTAVTKTGRLYLVDLAGSERVRNSGATGQRLEETKKINQSLSALGNVIAALTDVHGRQHIPYRDSKLTRILEDSLGGNCKTTMMAMISPALESITESLSTLKFANRAKNIKNEARVNEDMDQRSLLRKYERRWVSTPSARRSTVSRKPTDAAENIAREGVRSCAHDPHACLPACLSA